MGMNIKDPLVHAMARELAAHRGSSVTDAVRRALRAELDRCRELPWPDQRSGAELQAQLYDETGLPA